MRIDKLKITKSKFDINLKFYFFLKHLVKVSLSNIQANEIFKAYILNQKLNYQKNVDKLIKNVSDNLKDGTDKQGLLFEILDEINSELELKLFIFSLNLYMIKDLLLQEAKLKDLLDISKLKDLNPLSLKIS